MHPKVNATFTSLSLHCLCLCQAVQVENKETEEKEGGKTEEHHSVKGVEAALEKAREEKVSGPEEGTKGEKEEQMTEEEVKAPRAPCQPKTMQIKVILLDNTEYKCELDVRAFLIRIFSYIMHN